MAVVEKSKPAAAAPKYRERALATGADKDLWEVRDATGDFAGTLVGHFAVFNRWTEIDSFWEGRFMEQIAPGAFSKTFKENRKAMRCLFQHGRDPAIGMKPLGPIQELSQDQVGAAYEVGLLDTSYNRDLMPGLASGQYGASFRFQIIRESINEEPKRTDNNPDGIPERTIEEARVSEFGPVTFGAYEDATAGLRSLNDELIANGLERGGFDLGLLVSADPERLAQFQEFINHLRAPETDGNGRTASQEDGNTEDPPSRESTEAAPSTPEPGLHRSTPRASAARKLRTTRKLEEPKWKL